MTRRPHDTAHSSHVLLDTIDGDTLLFLGIGEPQDLADPGLRITYDGTGMTPCLRLSSADGEVELRGETEITRVTTALKLGRQMAKAFGDAIPRADWIKQQGKT